ncbi:MAG: helix-turn-helix transcriptional regulator [Caldilineaceae bacterium]|nr:helix-turn-helix transcriptional regulator [Caldilineaceae bacterium]
MSIPSELLDVDAQIDVAYDEHAERFKLLAHVERLRILNILRQDAECVCHLEAVLQKPQPYISQQLRILREAGVIQDEREGTNVFYRLVDEDVRRVLDVALGSSTPGHRTAQPDRCICPRCNG